MTTLSVLSTIDLSGVKLQYVDAISFDSPDADTSLTLWSRQFNDRQILSPLYVYGNAASDQIIVKVSGTMFADSWQFFGWGSEDRLVFNAGPRDATISGSYQSDIINGGAGNDSLGGNEGNDIVSGGAGNDTIYDYSGENRLSGGLDNDTITGGFDSDLLLGGDGDDILNDEQGGSSDVLHGGAGNDELRVSGGSNTLNGGSGDDRISCDIASGSGYGADRIYGGTGNDYLELGRSGAEIALTIDIREGGRGLDIGDGTRIQGIERIMFTGSLFADTIHGGNGDDIIDAGSGDNFLHGGGGNDQLRVSGGTNVINGGAGDDLVIIYAGVAEIDGGDGFDTVDLSFANAAAVTLDISTGGEDVGGMRLSFIEALILFGSSFADSVTGGAFSDKLTGYSGNDILIGGGGNDILWGSDGSDTLTGGTGQDSMLGSLDFNSDTFVFLAAADSAVGDTRDVIGDFESGYDVIDLSALPGSLSFIGSAGFGNAAGELRVTGGPGAQIVSGDIDGDGAADFEIAVTSAKILTAADFLL